MVFACDTIAASAQAATSSSSTGVVERLAQTLSPALSSDPSSEAALSYPEKSLPG